jgi:hypothetical protein
MGYALIWLEGASALLLLSALLVSWTARPRRRWLQLALTAGGALLLLLPSVAATVVTHELRCGGEMGLPSDWFFYTLSWLLAGLLGVILVCRRGLQRQADGVATALSWPRGKLLLALAAAVVLFAITLSNLDLAVGLQIAAARAEAGEVLLAVTPPRVPDKDNAAPLYRKAFAALVPVPRENFFQEHFRLSADVEAVRQALRSRELKEFLAAQQEGLTLLGQAAEMPGCSFERSYQQLADTPRSYRDLPELTQMSYAVCVLCLSALVHAAGDDGAAAVADLRAAFAMCRPFAMCRHVPTVFALRDGLHLEQVALDALQQLLLLSAPRPEDLARLPLKDDPPYLSKLHEEAAVSGAITIGIVSPETGLVRELVADQYGRPPDWLVSIGEATLVPVWRVFLVPDDLAASRRMWQDYRRQAAGEPVYPTWADAREAIDRRPGGLITNLYMKPYLKKLTRDSIDILTRRALARLALALTAYRSKNGHYPETMEELLPGYLARVPVDPLAGQPLLMQRGGSWLALCASATRGLQVQGGPPGQDETHRHDVVFWLQDRAKE